MSRDITTVREALMGEALKDMDVILNRIENVDKNIAATVEKATQEAVGRAYHSAHLTFKTMIDEREKKLLEAGRNAASLMGTQLSTGLTQLVAVNESLERKALRFIAIMAALAVLGGAIGGVVAVKMLGA